MVLLARDAAARGAEVLTRTRFVRAEREGDGWRAELDGGRRAVARGGAAIVNAAGPWVGQVVRDGLAAHDGRRALRLVRGSHIVTRRLFDHDRAYIFQQPDGRIVFAIPYEGDFTLIGTTDVEHDGAPGAAVCTPEERDYLLGAVSGYFRGAGRGSRTSSGAIPGCARSTTTAPPRRPRRRGTTCSRWGTPDGRAPVLSVFGGKITTHRRLAEAAMEKLAALVPRAAGRLDRRRAAARRRLPLGRGGALAGGLWVPRIRSSTPDWAARLVRLYGTEACRHARGRADGGGPRRGLRGGALTERELVWLREREWARTAEDVLWRRTKLGLRLGAGAGGARRRLHARRGGRGRGVGVAAAPR